MAQSIYRTEKKILEYEMWKIIYSNVELDFEDDDCDWFTIGDNTYVGGEKDVLVSTNPEIANLVNAVNALDGRLDLVNVTDRRRRR